MPQAHTDDVGIVGKSHIVVVGKKAQLLDIALAVVKDDGALPTAFLLAIEFAEMSDDALTRPSIGADALDEGIVSERFAILDAAMASEKHGGLLEASMAKETRNCKGVGFHYIAKTVFPLPKKPGNLQATGPKIALRFSTDCRNNGVNATSAGRRLQGRLYAAVR